VPHAITDGTVQTSPAQQPVGQDLAVQAQTPFLHSCPCAQLGPLPHAHAPATQESLVDGSQVAQAPPAVPQVITDGALQLPLAQQPFGQELASQAHAPFAHSCPCAQAPPLPHTHAPATQALASCGSHAMHELPPVPHAPKLGAVQASPAQQPLGHDCPSHTQRPF
jgi:hypothetical protein